jgi:hypothetical protein
VAQINGTPGSDTLVGTADADEISGRGGNDVLNGRGGADTLIGSDQYDLFRGGEGNDMIADGGGIDILELTGARGNYAVTETTPANEATRTYRIVDTRAGSPEGTDAFSGIETLRFELIALILLGF